MLAEYVALCKSINRFDFLFFSRELAKLAACWLKSFKAFCFDFVAIVCNNIVRCIISTHAKFTDFPIKTPTSTTFSLFNCSSFEYAYKTHGIHKALESSIPLKKTCFYPMIQGNEIFRSPFNIQKTLRREWCSSPRYRMESPHHD